MTITPATKNSRFLNKEEHAIYHIKDPKHHHEEMGTSSSLFYSSSFDNIDLSPQTQQVLKESKEDIALLLREHPEYNSLFLSYHSSPEILPKSPPASFLNMTQRFLTDPSLNHLKSSDHAFALFHEKMSRLYEACQKELKKSQQQIKKESAATYHHILQ
jgi:hypothetical protein